MLDGIIKVNSFLKEVQEEMQFLPFAEHVIASTYNTIPLREQEEEWLTTLSTYLHHVTHIESLYGEVYRNFKKIDFWGIAPMYFNNKCTSVFFKK